VLAGRDYVTPDDVKAIAILVLAHRLLLSPSARLKGVTPKTLTEGILENTTMPEISKKKRRDAGVSRAGTFLIQSCRLRLPEPPHKPSFHELRQHHIRRQHPRQDRPIGRWELDQAERRSQRRNGQPRPDRDDGQRGGDQCAACAALLEGYFVHADDVDDQRLGKEALDEPAGMEQGRVVPRAENRQNHKGISNFRNSNWPPRG
jgi:hypothetical protein